MKQLKRAEAETKAWFRVLVVGFAPAECAAWPQHVYRVGEASPSNMALAVYSLAPAYRLQSVCIEPRLMHG
jgi:hypothetical protein